MARRVRSIWESLAVESTEGPTVTVSLPRELAQELLGVLMGSLEMDGMGGPDDGSDDDMAELPDGDLDDLAGLAGDGSIGDGPGIPGIDDDPDDRDPDDDDDGSDDDDDDDDKDEGYGRARPQTALGERRRRR